MKYGFESKQAKKFPQGIIIALTNACNSKCAHCPHTFLNYDKQQFLSEELFTKVISEISNYSTKFIRITANGEPLLHPQVDEFICHATKANNGFVILTTNGQLLDDKRSELYLNDKIGCIEISLDAFSRELYEKVRVGLDFYKVQRNVLNLLDMRKELKSQTKVMISFIDREETHSEKDDFVRFWSSKVDRVIVRPFYKVANIVPGKINYAIPEKRYPCPQLWRRIMIAYDGQVRWCVNDWKLKNAIGSLSSSSIYDLWHNTEYEKLRQLHLDGQFSSIPMCKDCIDWAATSWNYSYEFAVKNLKAK